jgi:DNA-binding Lrp family transcriptional regulator
MQAGDSRWHFFTNHAHVLFYLQAHPRVPLRRVALEVGITERAVQRIVAELVDGGYLTRKKVGRQNTYQIHGEAPLRHPLEAHRSLQDLLDWVKIPEDDSLDEYKALENWTVGEHGSEV